jgi:hypothetical protein
VNARNQGGTNLSNHGYDILDTAGPRTCIPEAGPRVAIPERPRIQSANLRRVPVREFRSRTARVSLHHRMAPYTRNTTRPDSPVGSSIVVWAARNRDASNEQEQRTRVTLIPVGRQDQADNLSPSAVLARNWGTATLMNMSHLVSHVFTSTTLLRPAQ